MVKVFYCDITNNIDFEKFIIDFDKQRKDYVLSISDFERKRQSVLVWKLLNFCLNSFFCIKKPAFSFNNGVWELVDNNYFFSLSHSKNFVIVAISDINVGVDVEKYDDKILKLKGKLDYQGSSDAVSFLTLEWTKKESLFKARKGNNFFTENLHDKDNNEYCLTVCTNYNFADFISIDINKLI